jgi:hypothetical protein
MFHFYILGIDLHWIRNNSHSWWCTLDKLHYDHHHSNWDYKDMNLMLVFGELWHHKLCMQLMNLNTFNKSNGIESIPL